RAAWGASTPALPLDPARSIALSPDHARVVGSKPGAAHTPVLVDLATGKAGARPMCVAADTEPDAFAFRDEDSIPTALGFVDARTVACASGTLAFWSTSGDAVPPPPFQETTVPTELA